MPKATVTQSYIVDRWRVGPGYTANETFVRISALPPARPDGAGPGPFNEYEPTQLELGGLPEAFMAFLQRGAVIKITVEIPD